MKQVGQRSESREGLQGTQRSKGSVRSENLAQVRRKGGA